MLICWPWQLFQALHTGLCKAVSTCRHPDQQEGPVYVVGKRQLKAFKLRWCLTNAPVLAQADPDAPCEVLCDACGIGCCQCRIRSQSPFTASSYAMLNASVLWQSISSGSHHRFAAVPVLLGGCQRWSCCDNISHSYSEVKQLFRQKARCATVMTSDSMIVQSWQKPQA